MTIDPSTLEELTAYLDGELDPVAIQRVEQRLDKDPEYLAEMQGLQRTWELLDGLPAVDASASFTRTTMEMVVNDAVKQIKKRRGKWWLFPVRLAVFVGLPLILLALSYGLTIYNLDRPNRELIRQLPLIENYDQYNKVDANLDFLTALARFGYFADDEAIYANPQLSPDIFGEDTSPAVTADPESDADRKQRIESLDSDQKNALRRKYAEFEKITRAEKDRLQAFHEQLSTHPQRKQLTRSMHEYYVWLGTLDQKELAALLDMAPNQRLAEIGRIKTRQDREAFGRSGATALPTARDAEWLFDWLDIVISTKERLIRSRFPGIISKFYEQKGVTASDSALERFAKTKPIKTIMAFLFRIDRQAIEDIILQDVDLLRPNLSYEALAILDDQTLEGQRELILNWIASANQSRSAVSATKLQSFFEQLPQHEQDALDDLDADSWQEAVKLKYQDSRRTKSRSQTNMEDEWEFFLRDAGVDFN